MNKPLPTRKSVRLKNYDYSRSGYYFVTICTQVRFENILCEIVPSASSQFCKASGLPPVGAAALGGPQFTDFSSVQVNLTTAGRIVEGYLQRINPSYCNRVVLDCYVIMPDHVHFIVQLCPLKDGPPRAAAPTVDLPNVVNTLKALSTKKIGYPVWQRSYHDHIIRNDADLQAIRSYIQHNPLKWIVDRTEP